MRKLCTTKDFNVLFYECKHEGSMVFGFDILNKNKLVKLDKKDIIEINPECNMIKKLVSDDEVKVNIIEPLGLSIKEQAEYLGMNTRTLFRLRESLDVKK